MFDILFINDLNPGKLLKQFDKTTEKLTILYFYQNTLKHAKKEGTDYRQKEKRKES
jgi:hypothetical protein